MENMEIIRRNCLVPFLWTVEQDMNRNILIRNRLTGEQRLLDKK